MAHAKKSLFTNPLIIADIFLGIVLLLAIFHIFGSPPASNQNTIKKGEFKETAQQIANNCLKGNSDIEKCYKENFTQLLVSKDLSFAEHTLYALQDIDPQSRHCHVLSHEIAKAAVRKDPSKWKRLIEEVTVDTCGGGFLHGILEAHTGDDPDFKADAIFINETCYKKQLSFRERTCGHILGHLILLDTEGQIEPALPICAQTDTSLQLDCYNGIFMEDSFKLALAEHGFAELPVRDVERMNKQRERCLKYDGTPAVACWTDMAEIFVEFYNYEPTKAYELCNQAPFTDARNHCYLKAVILMAVSPNFDTQEELLKACSFYKENGKLYTHCTSFIISSLMHYSPKFADRGITLCSHIDDVYKEFCFKELGEKLKMNVSDRQEREHLCSNAPQVYKPLCIGIVF